MQQLEQYGALVREIDVLDRKISVIKAHHGEFTFDTVIGSAPEFPYVQRTYLIRGVIYTDIQLQELECTLEKRRSAAAQARCEIEKFICGIEESELRLIMEAKYIEGVRRWRDVAERISPYATADSVRMQVERFLKINAEN